MKQHKCQTTKHQHPSRKGGDIGRKERMNSQVLTVCFTKGITLMIEIRDYRGGDYGKEQQKQKGEYAANCVFSEIEQPKTKSNQ